MTDTPSPQASVVVVAYNGERFLHPCLESLARNATPPSEYELLLVDNASSDGTIAIAESFRPRFPHFRIVQNRENVGFPAAVNQAASLAKSPILVLLNQDTTVEPDWLGELIAPFGRDPSIASAGSRVVNADGPGLYAAALEVLYGGICVVHEGDRRTDAVSGCAMAVRLDAFHRVGGFEGPLFLYGEDLDLAHRLRAAGYRIVYVPSSVAYHRAARRSRASTRTYMFYMARNRTLVCLRNYRRKRLYFAADLLVFFPLTAFMEWLRSRSKGKALGWLLEARIESIRTGLRTLGSA